MPGGVRRLALPLAAALLAAVALARGVQLSLAAGREQLLTAYSESTWLRWASPQGLDALRSFAPVLERLRPGQPVVLVLPAGGSVRWWRVMAPYHLVRHELLAVQPRPLPPIPVDAAILLLRRNGEIEVRPNATDRGRQRGGA